MIVRIDNRIKVSSVYSQSYPYSWENNSFYLIFSDLNMVDKVIQKENEYYDGSVEGIKDG